mmetsp:Transcript_13498/g.27399  ORF Transcript_13498/g.27399 Transcript_13498/m.27399 type:complete len:368 (-) Transcript_13498:319-1422(-)
MGRRMKICLSAALLVWGPYYYLFSISTIQLQLIMETNDNNFKKASSYCTREEIKQGRWTEVTLPEAHYIPPEGYRKGVHAGSVCQDFSPTAFNTYEWMPHNSSSNHFGSLLNRFGFGRCIFDPWNPNDFCALGWKSIAIVGDSLSWEHYSSLVMSLGLHSDPNDQFVSRRLKKNIITMACNSTLKLIYRRSDQLEYVPHVIREEQPQMLILNKGSHPVNDEIYKAGWQETINTLEEYEQNLTESGLPSLFLFRTTVPGHPQCEIYTAPVNNITQMEAVIANKSSYKANMLKFRWWEFKAQNVIMENLLTASRLRNYHILDAYDINIRRPDHHRPPDCLHNCFPSKTEVYHQLMLHFLKVSANSSLHS